MSFLTNELAQQMVNRTMKILNRNINVMNDQGIIIGSGDINRIQQLHHGAVLVLKKNKKVEIYADTANQIHGAKPGINLPIHFHKQTVGVIGITGNPDEIRHCAELVQMAAELVLEQSFLLEQVQWKQRLQNEVVNQLIHEQNVNVALVKERASILGIELDQPRAVIIIKNPEEKRDPSSLRHQLDYILDQADLIGFTYHNEIVILKAIGNRTIESFLNKIDDFINGQNGKKYLIGSGSICHSLSELKYSYEQAKNTIIVGKKLHPEKFIFLYSSYQFEVFLYSHAQKEQTLKSFSFYRKLIAYDQSGELEETLHIYLNENGEQSKVAEKLFIHRNTLRYRLEKITEITGKNPRHIKDLMQLYTAKLLYDIDSSVQLPKN